MTDSDGDDVRGVLLEHSDHQAVRNVFGDHTGGGEATVLDYVEAMRATAGRLALVASDGAGETYARWDGRSGRYEYLTIWPPWTIGAYESTDGGELREHLEEKEDVRPMAHGHTPFADEQALAGAPVQLP